MPKGVKSGRTFARLRSAVLCDQVRSEDTGKRLLIGVYDSGAVIGAVPALFTASLYGVFEVMAKGIRVIHFRLTGPHEIGEGRIDLGGDAQAGSAAAFIAPFVCLVEESGSVRLDWKADEGEWVEALKWELAVPDNATHLDPHSAEQIRQLFHNQLGLPKKA